MADYVVSGAGAAMYNGDYTANGTHGGKTAYEQDAGGNWLFYGGVPAGWKLNPTVTDALGLPVNYPYYNQTGATPDVDPWVAGAGLAPAPTVAAATGSGSGAGATPMATYPGGWKAPEVYVEVRDWSGNITYRTNRIEQAEWELAMLGGAGPFTITFNEGYKSDRYNIHLDLVTRDNFPIGNFVRIVVNGDVWYEGIIQAIQYLRADQVEVRGTGPRVMFSWMQDWGCAWRADERDTGDVTYSQLEVADVYMDLVNTLYGFGGYSYPAVGGGETEVEMDGYFTPRTDGYQLMETLAKVGSSIWGVTYIHNPTAAGLASNNRILFMMDMPTAHDTQQAWVTELLQHNFAWNDLFATSPMELRGDNIVNRLHLRGEEWNDPWAANRGNLLTNADFINCNPQDGVWAGGGVEEYWYWFDWKDWVVCAESENSTDPNPAVASTPYTAAEPGMSGGSGICFVDYGVGAGERENPTHIWIHPVTHWSTLAEPAAVGEELDTALSEGYNALAPVVAGMNYTFEYSIYSTSNTIDYAVNWQWFDDDGTNKGNSDTAWVDHDGTGWKRPALTMAAPVGATWGCPGILIRLTANMAIGTGGLWIDGAMLSQSAIAQTFQLSNQVEKYYDVSTGFGASPQELQDSDDNYGPRIAGQNISTSSTTQMDTYAENYLLAWSTPYWQGTFRYVGEPRLIHPYLGLIQLHGLPVGLDTRRYTSLDTNGLLGCERVVYTYKQDSFEMEMMLKSPRTILGPAEDQAREPGLIGKMLPPWYRDKAGYEQRGFYGGTTYQRR